MKFLQFLPLVGTAFAFVIPNQDVLENSIFESNGVREMSNALDDALESHELRKFLEDWSAVEGETDDEIYDDDYVQSDNPFHYQPQGLNDDEDHEDDAPLANLLDHPAGHDKPTLTVYEMIVKSKYTTKLAELVKNDTELIDVLNKSDASLTVFAPTDKAFAKLPDHDKEIPKEFIRKVLLNHISGDFYPAKKVLKSYTIPTLLEEKSLGGPQRLAIKLGPHGLTVNFFSRVIAANIFATNGVIHGVDNIVFLPPPALPIIEATPSAFSTLALGLFKTGLFKGLGDLPHVGSILFAPTNRGFRKLGPRINAFLFSRFGTKYLKALLKYHVVHNATLYSDAFYHDENTESQVSGHGHFDLPTLLEDREIPVDIKKLGPFTSIIVNNYVKVAVSDAPTKDGVIHVVDHVLIPPRKHDDDDDDDDDDSTEFMEGDRDAKLTVEDFMRRLEPYVDDDADVDEAIDKSVNEDEFHDDEWSTTDESYPDWSKMYL